MLSFRTILHPTDFSPYSDAALRLACSLARDYRARLILLHVKEPEPDFGERFNLPPEPPEVRQALRDQLSQRRPNDPALQVEEHLEEGDPAARIVSAAVMAICVRPAQRMSAVSPASVQR